MFSAQSPFQDPSAVCANYTRYIDQILIDIFNLYLQKNELSEKLCMLALGGYGRRELAPYSDIDLLIIYPSGVSLDKIKKVTTPFWDAGLNMSLLSRSLDQCKNTLGEEIATDMSYLDARYIAGQKSLFNDLHNNILNNWYKYNKFKYIKYAHNEIKNHIIQDDHSLYKIEPNLKSDYCYLRDCQLMVWLYKILQFDQNLSIDILFNSFPHGVFIDFKNAYNFILGLRNELHLSTNFRFDVLEVIHQTKISEKHRKQFKDPADLMQQLFNAVFNIKQFADFFLEQTAKKDSLVVKTKKYLSKVKISKAFYLIDGIIYIEEKNFHGVFFTPVVIINLFYQAAQLNASLSLKLKNKIYEQIKYLQATEFQKYKIIKIFINFLAMENPIAELLVEMHETGLLSKIIPEFKKLKFKVEFDIYHEYPVDEHTLMMLKDYDKFFYKDDPYLGEIIRKIDKPYLIRLTFILHDIGKVHDSDHAEKGALISENICDRLGLEDADKKLIFFLIKQHLLLSKYSFQKDFYSEEIRDFVKQVNCQTNLDYLFILTYFDIKNVGEKTLTGWKKQQLLEIYKAASNYFNENPGRIEADQSLLYLKLQDDQQFYLQKLNGFDRIIFYDEDRKNLFLNVIACMTSEGLNILSTKAYTTAEKKVIDIFHVQPDKAKNISSEERLDNIKTKYQKLLNQETTTDKIMLNFQENYHIKSRRFFNKKKSTLILVDNPADAHYTVIEITTFDRFGLLYDICSCLAKYKLNIYSAKINLNIEAAVDTFYVLDADNQKLNYKIRHKLRDELIDLLA